MLKARARCSARTPSRINENAAGGRPASPAPSPNRPKNRCQKVFANPHKIPIIDQKTRSEEHTSELQSLMRISYAVLCLKKKNTNKRQEAHMKNTKKPHFKQ